MNDRAWKTREVIVHEISSPGDVDNGAPCVHGRMIECSWWNGRSDYADKARNPEQKVMPSCTRDNLLMNRLDVRSYSTGLSLCHADRNRQ